MDYGNVMSGDVSGDIAVTANGGGGLSVLGGDTYGAYAMVGHGGFGGGQITGTTNGNITVIVDGDILLDAGDTQNYTWAQIGHGGRNNDGNMGLAGEQISVVSRNGNLDLLASSTSRSIAMIGHGDGGDASGTRQGDILVDIGNGEISLVANGNPAWIGHRTNSGAISDANVTIVAESIDAVAGDQSGTVFDVNTAFGDMLEADLLGGDVTLYSTGSGGLLMNSTGEMVYNASKHFTMLSAYDIYFADHVLNQGGWQYQRGWLVGDTTVAPLASLTGIIANVDMDGKVFCGRQCCRQKRWQRLCGFES